MKKRALLLGLVLALLVAIPASAGIRRIEPRIGLWVPPTTFAADAPFRVEHGFALVDPQEDGPVSGYLFTLEVDGVPVRRSFKETIAIIGEDHDLTHTYWFVFNFPDGLPAGTHTLIGRWYYPCKITEAECDRPNKPTDPFGEPFIRGGTISFTGP